MNISVFHGGDLFIRPFLQGWIAKGHSFRVSPNFSYWPGFDPDLLWFEMCTGNLVFYTKKDKKLQGIRTICRAHGVGIRMNIYKSVDWNKVDDFIFVSNWLKRQTNGFDFGKTKLHVVNNGVDLDKFTLKKSFKPTYKLAFVAHKSVAKGYNELPAIVEKFKKIDSRYELYEANKQIKHEDMNDWLEDKDYLIHPSHYESFSFAVAEAMAKGIRPLINNWLGAEETWGDEFFIDDFNLEQDPHRFRGIIEEKYNIERKKEEMNAICSIY